VKLISGIVKNKYFGYICILVEKFNMGSTGIEREAILEKLRLKRHSEHAHPVLWFSGCKANI